MLWYDWQIIAISFMFVLFMGVYSTANYNKDGKR